MAEYSVKKYAPRKPKTYRKTTTVELPEMTTPAPPQWEVRGITIAMAMARARVIKLTKIAEDAIRKVA
jgi:hypothetical protein